MIRQRQRLLITTAALLSLLACEEPFEPLQEPTRYFSMYGALDLNADTQWIRVMPIRESTFSGPEPIDATVTLEHLGTGRTVELEDSMFRYRFPGTDPDLVDDLWMHNFWTTEPIEPESTYRIRARSSDGATSMALVETPPVPERVVVEIAQPRGGPGSFQDQLQVVGAYHLAMVQIRYHVAPDCPQHPFVTLHHPRTTVSDSGGSAKASVSWRTARRVCGDAVSETAWRDFTVYISGTTWPFEAELEGGTYQHIDAGTNVEDGVGYIGGIAIIRVPYEMCTVASGADPAAVCRITYDDTSAWLEGTLLDTRCGQEVLKARVTLRKADDNLVREVYGDWHGRYRFGGLEPGTTYHIDATAPYFEPYEGTLTLAPGEHRVHDLEMKRPGVCI